MFKKCLLAVGVLFAAASLCLAQQDTQGKPAIKKETIKQTSAASGKEMYLQYCAPCHGTDGKGAGPAAPAMKAPPADLTQLAKTHGDKYPDAMVTSILRFGSGLSAHGSADMPVWGRLFQSLDKYHDSAVQQRISNVVKYVESLQAK